MRTMRFFFIALFIICLIPCYSQSDQVSNLFKPLFDEYQKNKIIDSKKFIDAYNKNEFFHEISRCLVPRITVKGKISTNLTENNIGTYLITPKSEIELKISDSDLVKYASKLKIFNKYALSDILDSVVIRVYNEGQKDNILYLKYSNTPVEKELQLPTNDFKLPLCNPFDLGLDWKDVIDRETVFSITLKYSDNSNLIKTYYGKLIRPFYIDLIGLSGFYLTDTKRIPNISFNNLNSVFSTSNISFGTWLVRLNFQADILGLNKISIALPTLYQIMNDDNLGLKTGFGVGFNVFIEKFTIGVGYDLTNSKSNDPIFQLLIGTDLLSLITVNGSTK